MTHEEIVKYTDHLLAEFYKDCQKQLNKENRQVDIVLTNGDFSTLQNIMCEAVIKGQNQMLDKACAWLKDTMDYLDCGDYDRLTHYADTIEEMIDDFRKAMED